MFQLIFRRRFSMAHRLIAGLSPQCSIPHGHNEYVEVIIAAKNPKRLDGSVNMVELFETAKKKWHCFIDEKIDHSFQLSDQDPLLDFFQQKEPGKLENIVVTPGDPTTEMLCACFMSKVQCFLDAEANHLVCLGMKIEETPTNTVFLTGVRAYEKYLPWKKEKKKSWWERADLSINDFVS